MDTSDSECFESADESLHSDDEDTTTIISSQVKNLEIKCDLKKQESEILHETTAVDAEKQETCESVKTVSSKDSDASPRKEDVAVQNVKKSEDDSCNLKKQESKVVLEETVINTEEKKKCDSVIETVSNKASEILLKKEDILVENVIERDDDLWADDEGWGNLDADNIEDNTQLPPDLKKGKLVSKYVPDEDKWEFDSWEPIETQQQQQQQHQEQDKTSWGGWSNWGVSSIISTGVSTLTQGISNVLDVPQPEELARQELINDNENNNPSENSTLNFGFGNLVSGVTQITKIVESTGTKVINSGLDTLETIGKKTMEVLQEGDPGLKRKRAFLQIQQEKPVLSQILREAKQKAEAENKILEEKHFARKANYESIFDDCQGLVHLEALEMLSKQCDIKLQTVLETYSGDKLKEVQETMEQVKELCEIPDDEEDEETMSFEEIQSRLENAVSEIGIGITYEKLITTWNETEDWLGKINMNVCSERELHQQAIETLAQLTAIAVEQFHKGGELLLIKEHRSTADEADSLVQLTTTLTALIGIVAAKFSDKLNALTTQNKEQINSLITNIFLEAANSSSYIQDAFQLLIPVLQVGAI